MPLGPSLDPFPIKQVANGRGGARQLQTDSVPSPVWLSLEDITKEDHSSMARSVNMWLCVVFSECQQAPG